MGLESKFIDKIDKKLLSTISLILGGIVLTIVIFTKLALPGDLSSFLSLDGLGRLEDVATKIGGLIMVVRFITIPIVITILLGLALSLFKYSKTKDKEFVLTISSYAALTVGYIIARPFFSIVRLGYKVLKMSKDGGIFGLLKAGGEGTQIVSLLQQNIKGRMIAFALIAALVVILQVVLLMYNKKKLSIPSLDVFLGKANKYEQDSSASDKSDSVLFDDNKALIISSEIVQNEELIKDDCSEDKEEQMEQALPDGNTIEEETPPTVTEIASQAKEKLSTSLKDGSEKIAHSNFRKWLHSKSAKVIGICKISIGLVLAGFGVWNKYFNVREINLVENVFVDFSGVNGKGSAKVDKDVYYD